MYYVYQYIDPRNNQPFYIGKGIRNRKFSHLEETLKNTINKRKFYRIRAIRKLNLEPIIEELKTFSNEDDAYCYEEEMIKLYGRKGYDKNGILMNITLGSRPPSRKGKKLTEDQIEKRKGKKLSEEHKEKLRGKIPWNKGTKGAQTAWNKGIKGISRPQSEETKEKLRKINLGKKKSIETRKQMSKNMKGRIPHNKGKQGKPTRSMPARFLSPTGTIYDFKSFKEGCKTLNLPTSKISQVNTGKLKDYKGWTVKSLIITEHDIFAGTKK